MGKNKLLKQQEAKQRQDKRDKISPKEQLSHLDSIFGKDVGAKKERDRLLSLINKKSEKKETKEEKPKKKKKKKDD
jgi:hypothetical protein